MRGRGGTLVTLFLQLECKEAIIRRTLHPRLGYREGLTRLQLWLLNALMQQTVFDIWDLLLSEMEDTIAEGFKGRRQLPYAHWITFLMLKAVSVRTPEMVAEYRGATTEFLAYNMAQRIRHSTPQAPSQPRRLPDVPVRSSAGRDYQRHSRY